MKRPTPKTGHAPKLSPFALALTRLLDETSYFESRSEWARFLGVTTSALSQWVHDRTVPRADLLRMILDALRSSTGVPKDVLDAFDDVAARPARDVSPLGERMAPTVREYLASGTLAGFGRALRTFLPRNNRKR